jgi:hypothetical protein
MAYPSTGSKTELQAINQILASVGQAPVTTLETETIERVDDGTQETIVTNPDVAIAYDTLQEVSREVQAEGWTFNKEYDFPLPPESVTNFIYYPANALQVDLSNNPQYTAYAYIDIVKKENRLYDRRNHTDQWTEPLYCDITWWRPWTDLPAPIQDYITARAATIVSSRIVGDGNQYQILQQKESYCRAMALEYECNQGDYSFFGTPREGSAYQSFQPFKALQRW